MFLSDRTKETCFTFNNVENISAKTRHCEICFKTNPANIYLPKVNNRNTRKRYEICSVDWFLYDRKLIH